MKKISVLILVTLLLMSSIQVHACTIFSASDGNQVLVGNNEDWYDKDTYVSFLPAEKEKYGRVFFGFEGASIEGGINDQGLFFDWVAFKDRNYNHMPPLAGRVDYTGNLNISALILETCASVKDALKVYEKYNEYNFGFATILLADKSGDSATVTWNPDKNKLDIIHKTWKYQVTGYGEEKVQHLLSASRNISAEFFKTLLDAAHQGDLTVYSNIYDLKNGDIFIYNQHNFNEYVKYNLAEELKKGKHMRYIPALFPKQKPGVYDQLTPYSGISDTAKITNLLLFSVSLLSIFTFCILYPASVFLKKKKSPNKAGLKLYSSTVISLIIGVINSLLIIWLLYVIVYYGGFITSYGWDIYSHILKFVPPVMIFTFLGQVIFTVLAWKKKYWNIFTRLLYTLLAIAVLLGLFSLYSAKLLI